MAISAKELPKNHTDKERFAAASSFIATEILTLLFARKRRRSTVPVLYQPPRSRSRRVSDLKVPIKPCSPNRPLLPPTPPPQKNYKQKHGLGFSLDYCDTQNTSDLELKQCLHTTWDPLLLHYYVSPKNLAPFRTLPQLFSTHVRNI